MTEERQVTKEPQQVQQVTMNDPKKVESGKRMAEYISIKREKS